MHNHADGGSDIAVSFDAFKVAKNVDHVPGRVVTWSVAGFTPWARDMIKATPRPVARGVAVGRGDSVVFDTRADALSFLRDLERAASRWSASSISSRHRST
jgi:hypothetical protein